MASKKSGTKNWDAVRQAEEDHKAQIAHDHALRKEQFLVRDSARFPGGWRLPADAEEA